MDDFNFIFEALNFVDQIFLFWNVLQPLHSMNDRRIIS